MEQENKDKSRGSKVGILNFQYSTHNYGAVLQAAALEIILKKIDCVPVHIDFVAKPPRSFKGYVGQLLRKMRLRQLPKAQTIGNKEAFERFRIKFISRTNKIRKPAEFSKVAEKFDSVVVGSDQVWRPAFAKDPIAFFLGYTPEGIARISYAASFGTSTWELSEDVRLTNKVRNELTKFKAISCREESGVDICREIFSVHAVHVIDPLLLVDKLFFEQIIAESSVKSGSDLVYYKLDSNEEFFDDLKVIGNKLGGNAVNIYLKGGFTQEYQEVSDWLYLIYNSKIVITDSFHCICLALRFGKEVIYCPNENRGQARLDSLFNKLNVNVEPLGIALKTQMFKLVRQGNVDAILKIEQVKSMRFLTDALCITEKIS